VDEHGKDNNRNNNNETIAMIIIIIVIFTMLYIYKTNFLLYLNLYFHHTISHHMALLS
jgi:hypothetical protein